MSTLTFDRLKKKAEGFTTTSDFCFKYDNQMGILYQTENFLTACISLAHEPDNP